MIDSSTIKSLENTYHFLSEVVPSELHNLAIVEIQDSPALAVQGRIAGGRGGGSDFGARGHGGGRDNGRSGGRA